MKIYLNTKIKLPIIYTTKIRIKIILTLKRYFEVTIVRWIATKLKAVTEKIASCCTLKFKSIFYLKLFKFYFIIML